MWLRVYWNRHWTEHIGQIYNSKIFTISKFVGIPGGFFFFFQFFFILKRERVCVHGHKWGQGEGRGRGRENPRGTPPWAQTQQDAQSYDPEIMTWAQSLTYWAIQAPVGVADVLKGPGRCRNNCHKRRSFLDSQIPRKEVLRAMKGQQGKWEKEGVKGKCGQEPSLWFPREGTREAGWAGLRLVSVNNFSGPGP